MDEVLDIENRDVSFEISDDDNLFIVVHCRSGILADRKLDRLEALQLYKWLSRWIREKGAARMGAE